MGGGCGAVTGAGAWLTPGLRANSHVAGGAVEGSTDPSPEAPSQQQDILGVRPGLSGGEPGGPHGA